MGSPRDETYRSEDEDGIAGEGGSQVEVTLTKDFWLRPNGSDAEAMVRCSVGTRPWQFEPDALDKKLRERDDIAVTMISHNEAMEYCDKLTKREQHRQAG